MTNMQIMLSVFFDSRRNSDEISSIRSNLTNMKLIGAAIIMAYPAQYLTLIYCSILNPMIDFRFIR